MPPATPEPRTLRAATADSLLVDPAEHERALAALSTAAVMRGEGMPRAQRSLEQLGRTHGVGERLGSILRKASPSPGLMRTWKPLPRRVRAGLLLAYLWRPPWLLWQLVLAAGAYLRARRL